MSKTCNSPVYGQLIDSVNFIKKKGAVITPKLIIWIFFPQLENTLDKVDKVNEAGYEEVKAPNDLNQTASLTQTKENEALELLTNDIVVEKGKWHKYLLNLSSRNLTHKIAHQLLTRALHSL